MQPTVCRCPSTSRLVPIALVGKENGCGCATAHAVPWLVKFFVSDPGVSCLLMAPMKLCLNHLLAQKENKISGPLQISVRYCIFSSLHTNDLEREKKKGERERERE